MEKMNSFVEKLKFWSHDDEASSGDEIFDKDATSLSHVGNAVHDVLRKHHNRHHHTMWNVTRGTVIGEVQQTPSVCWDNKDDPGEGHSDWFVAKMEEMIGKTERWCDVTSLGPPDGKFMGAFQRGLKTLADKSAGKEKPVVVRMMFGNIAGMPVNCTAVIKALTSELDATACNLHLWVGAWRKGLSWNHSKMIAVDGVHLHTGGHNLWDAHYLSNNPVHDLSIQFEGPVTRDGHRFANQQWGFVESKQKTCTGSIVDMMPDYLPVLKRTRVTVSEWPEGVATVFPPMFTKEAVTGAVVPSGSSDDAPAERSTESDVPLISIGRQGSMIYKSRPADDAILAMINSSKTIIRMTLQDIGPVCVPGTKKSLPGLKWPKTYLAALGKAIYERGVDVEMVLSNPNSIPGGLKGTEANYGNGWDCVDVAAEIIKTIQKSHANVDDEKLRAMITENLRICFLRHDSERNYADGKSIGLHSKHFIVDDTCCYIGSQNLYMCDLAEWGVVIDSEPEVTKIKQDYFDKVWKNSFTGEDVDVQAVMDGLKINRDGEKKKMFGSHDEGAAQYGLMPHGCGEYYGDAEEETAIEVSDGELPKVETKDGDDDATTATPIPPKEAFAKDDAADASVAPDQPTSEPDIAGGSVAPQGTKSEEVEGEEKKETEVVEKADCGEDCHGQVHKIQADCNWCGMGEALNINSRDE